MAKITCRVANAYGSAATRVRDAENTTKQPATVRASCTDISTQSMLRLGSAGLAPMLPRPESGLRLKNEVAIGAQCVSNRRARRQPREAWASRRAKQLVSASALGWAGNDAVVSSWW